MKENPLLTLAVLALSLATVFKTAVLAAEADASTVVEFEGMIVPAREAEITPLVSGWLKKIDFVPGQYVHEGDVLFEFDQTPQKVKIKLAEAQLKSARASLQDAEVKLKRAMTLQSKDVVTESILQEAEAGRDIAAANVEQAKFSIELLEIDLSHLTQKAPFSGMMSAPLVMENGWQEVSGREHIRMAVITQLDPIHVVGKIPYSVFAEQHRIPETGEAAKKRVVLSIVLPDGDIYPYEGRLVSGGYKFDEDTQKITVWAEFPNPDLLLHPGLAVKLRSLLAKQ